MINPNDPDSPRGSTEDADPDQLAAAAERDLRTPAQMQHDALTALLKAVFDDGLLGKVHRGLPMNRIIKSDLHDLARTTGYAISADGTLIPRVHRHRQPHPDLHPPSPHGRRPTRPVHHPY